MVERNADNPTVSSSIPLIKELKGAIIREFAQASDIRALAQVVTALTGLAILVARRVESRRLPLAHRRRYC